MPFLTLLWGRAPLLKWTTEKMSTLILLSTGGPSILWCPHARGRATNCRWIRSNGRNPGIGLRVFMRSSRGGPSWCSRWVFSRFSRSLCASLGWVNGTPLQENHLARENQGTSREYPGLQRKKFVLTYSKLPGGPSKGKSTPGTRSRSAPPTAGACAQPRIPRIPPRRGGGSGRCRRCRRR